MPQSLSDLFPLRGWAMPRKRTHLSAVDPAAPPVAPGVQKSVTQAAADGTTRELYVAMRARIAKAVEEPNTPARDLAALTKRLAEVVREIEAIDARKAEDDHDGPAEDADFDASAV